MAQGGWSRSDQLQGSQGASWPALAGPLRSEAEQAKTVRDVQGVRPHPRNPPFTRGGKAPTLAKCNSGSARCLACRVVDGYRIARAALVVNATGRWPDRSGTLPAIGSTTTGSSASWASCLRATIPATAGP